MTDPAPPAGADPTPGAPSAAAVTVLGTSLPLLERYVDWLAGAGIERGLLGPREVPRLWERHVVNCAAMAGLLPAGARIVDVGTGAGLPGLVLALVRPDISAVLLDATARRTQFLADVVADLGVGDRVRMVTGRAEDRDVQAQAGVGDAVVSRAVAPLPRLVGWCLPVLADGGTVLAMKGARAHDEVRDSRRELRRRGVEVADVHAIEFAGQTTTVVELRRRDGVSRGTSRGEQ